MADNANAFVLGLKSSYHEPTAATARHQLESDQSPGWVKRSVDIALRTARLAADARLQYSPGRTGN
jgi:hypothetical protein